MSKKKTSPQNDSSNLKTFKDASTTPSFDPSQEAKDSARLILQLQAELQEKDQKIKNLENIIQYSLPILDQSGTVSIDEVTIAKLQLQKLGMAAAMRELTNDESRRFEIFAKIIQADAKNDKGNGNKKLGQLKDVTPSRLIEIAQIPIKVEYSEDK